jgi:hypothetical protein
MSVNQNRQSRQRRKAFDAAFDAYLEWRMRCDAVERTYSQWRFAHDDAAAWAFSAYERALDREESAANSYAAAMARVAELVKPRAYQRLAEAHPSASGLWL